MKTSIVVVTIALAAAILLSVSLFVAKDARRDGALEAPAVNVAASSRAVVEGQPFVTAA